MIYVALTRARDYLVLPFAKIKSNNFWELLSRVTEAPGQLTPDFVQTLKAGVQNSVFKDDVHDKKDGIDILMQELDAPVLAEKESKTKFDSFYLDLKFGSCDAADKFISPSRIKEEMKDIEITEKFVFKNKVQLNEITEKLDLSVLGNCIHNFMAIYDPENENKNKEILSRLLKNYDLEKVIDSTSLLKYTDEFYKKMLSLGVEINTEITLEYKTKMGQVYSGQIDMVVKNKENLYLIDHKIFFVDGPEKILIEETDKKIKNEFASQLLAYEQMAKAEYEKEINVNKWVHLPMQGRILELK